MVIARNLNFGGVFFFFLLSLQLQYVWKNKKQNTSENTLDIMEKKLTAQRTRGEKFYYT